MPFNLPQNFEIVLPDLNQFANDTIGTPESGFAPNLNLPRVTDQERSEHELIFREQANAADNLKDAIKVANKYVTAGIAATKLGKDLITYQIGLQDIRTEKVNFQKSVTRTEVAVAELEQLRLNLGYQNNLIPVLEQEFTHKLREAQSKAERALRSAMNHEHETEMRFPILNVQATAINAA